MEVRNAVTPSRFLATLIGIFALLPSIGCGTAPSRSRANVLPVIAIHVSTSFEDTGVKAIVFPQGLAFVMQYGKDAGAERPCFHMRRVLLPHEGYQSLLDTFEQHHFSALPRSMRERVCDGGDVFVLYADVNHEHWVHSYMSIHPDYTAISNAFGDTLSKPARESDRLSATEFLEGISAEMRKLPADSLPRKTASMWLDLLVRSGGHFPEVEDCMRFILPGKRSKLYEDLPPDKEEFEDLVPIEEEKAEKIIDAAEVLTDTNDPFLELEPIVVDLPLLER